MSDRADLEARLAELERRVSALEGERPAPVTAPAPAPVTANLPDAFWALTRLQADYPQGALLFAGHVHLPTGEHWRWKELAQTPDLLAADWEGAAPMLAALGHPLRLAILRAVVHGQRTTAELQADPNLAAGGKLYHHLRDLQAGGWLLLRGRGQYSVPAERVLPLLVILQAAGVGEGEA